MIFQKWQLIKKYIYLSILQSKSLFFLSWLKFLFCEFFLILFLQLNFHYFLHNIFYLFTTKGNLFFVVLYIFTPIINQGNNEISINIPNSINFIFLCRIYSIIFNSFWKLKKVLFHFLEKFNLFITKDDYLC